MQCTAFIPHTCSTAIFAVVLFIGCIPWVSTEETIVISYGTGNSQPSEGDINYKLDCTISDSDNPAVVWSKDGRFLFWSTGTTVSDLDQTGDYAIEKVGTNPIHFILTFLLVKIEHTGFYSCFSATGEPHNPTFRQSSRLSIIVNPTTLPEGEYFPSSEWPKCYPKSDTRVLLYTDMIVRCASTAGNPPVAVNIHDASTGQLSNSYISTFPNFRERFYTYIVQPTDNFNQFYCQIIARNGMRSQCTTGTIEIRLFQYDHNEVMPGDVAFFECHAGPGINTVHWSTDPPITPSRLEITGNLLRISDVEVADNGTKVFCSIEGFDLQDHVLLLVLPPNAITLGTTSQPTSQETIYIPTASPSAYIPTLEMEMSEKPNEENTANLSTRLSMGLCVIMLVIEVIIGSRL